MSTAQQTEAPAIKLTKAQERALEVIGTSSRKSAGFWRELGVSQRTLDALIDADLLRCETYGNSNRSRWVYWREESGKA